MELVEKDKELNISVSVLTNLIGLLEGKDIAPVDFVLDFAPDNGGESLGRIVLSFVTRTEMLDEVVLKLSKGVDVE